MVPDHYSQPLPEPDENVDTGGPSAGHENHQPPGDRPAGPAIEEWVEKGAVKKKNRKEIEQEPHDSITSS